MFLERTLKTLLFRRGRYFNFFNIKSILDEANGPDDVVGMDDEADLYQDMEISIDETSIKCEEDLTSTSWFVFLIRD